MSQRRKRAFSAAVQTLFGGDGMVDVIDPFDTHLGCWGAACDLFYKIEERRGSAEAKHIFRELGSPSAQRLRIINDTLLLRFCEEMKRDHGWSPQKCARELAKLNTILRKNDVPRTQRALIQGTRGSESEDALRNRIKEAVKRMSRPSPKR
jgi:hypothetical protein